MGHYSFRRYLIQMSASLAITLIAALGLNRMANPFSLFSTDCLRHQNKPETFSHSRLVKANQVRHTRPRGLILGSSRAESGIDPEHPAWKVQPVYNLGLSGARIYEVMRYFQHACAVSKIDQVVLIVDFFAFIDGGGNSPDFSEERLAVAADGSPQFGIAWRDWASGLISMEACMASFDTMLHESVMMRYLPNGSRNYKWDAVRTLARGGAKKAFRSSQENGNHLMVPNRPLLDIHGPKYLLKILQLARLQKIDLRIAIGPTHVQYLEDLDRVGQWELYLEWMRIMATTVESEGRISGHAPFPLVDFNGYLPYNEETVPEAGIAEFYLDPFHFTPKLGGRMLPLLLGPLDALTATTVGSFGVLINDGNIDAQILAHRNLRQNFLSRSEADAKIMRN